MCTNLSTAERRGAGVGALRIGLREALGEGPWSWGSFVGPDALGALERGGGGGRRGVGCVGRGRSSVFGATPSERRLSPKLGGNSPPRTSGTGSGFGLGRADQIQPRVIGHGDGAEAFEKKQTTRRSGTAQSASRCLPVPHRMAKFPPPQLVR